MSAQVLEGSAKGAGGSQVPGAVGPAAAWRQIGLLMQWQMRRSATVLPLLVVVQSMLSVATVIGYGLLVGPVDRLTGLYLTTGAPTICLVMLGLVMTPQWVGQERTEGSLDWMRTLPVPRGPSSFPTWQCGP